MMKNSCVKSWEIERFYTVDGMEIVMLGFLKALSVYDEE